MKHESINLHDLLASLPSEWSQDPMLEIRRRVEVSGRKVVVLDDDPMGTQTVHDLPILTEWSVESLCVQLLNDYPAFYILTNSRSMTLDRAQSVNAEIGRNLVEASSRVGREFTIISRSDSTLRGHFPGEVSALADALEQDFHAWVLIPFFLEGGRYTVRDIHYVSQGDLLVPAAETEFARDPVFGFYSSHLRRWVEEKTCGHHQYEDMYSISIDDIRLGGPEVVAERVMEIEPGSICIANAASNRDLEVLTLGFLLAEEMSLRLLYRTAASFVRVRAGLSPGDLLSPKDLDLPESGGGLIVVGSHVPRTTEQLDMLLARTDVQSMEVSAEALADKSRSSEEIVRVARWVNETLDRGDDAVIYTSRELLAGSDADACLSTGCSISDGLVSIVRSVNSRPRYLLSKGGITSSDIVTRALDARQALVLGQVLPGVPVWRMGEESRWPGLLQVLFPGNVGDPDALLKMVGKFRQPT